MVHRCDQYGNQSSSHETGFFCHARKLTFSVFIYINYAWHVEKLASSPFCFTNKFEVSIITKWISCTSNVNIVFQEILQLVQRCDNTTLTFFYFLIFNFCFLYCIYSVFFYSIFPNQLFKTFQSQTKCPAVWHFASQLYN